MTIYDFVKKNQNLTDSQASYMFLGISYSLDDLKKMQSFGRHLPAIDWYQFVKNSFTDRVIHPPDNWFEQRSLMCLKVLRMGTGST